MSDYGRRPKQHGIFEPIWDEYMSYMYLPIAMPEFSLSCRVPEPLAFGNGMLTAAMLEESRRGNQWTYIYLTAKRGFATPGNPLNRPGWHADGFGTDDVNYVWTDRWPTLFAVQYFNGISTDHNDSIDQFTEQINPGNIVTFADKELLRLDPFVIHAAPEIPAPGGERGFFKISFSNSRYDLRGNSHNYEFDYAWPMHSRTVIRNDPARAGQDSTAKEIRP